MYTNNDITNVIQLYKVRDKMWRKVENTRTFTKYNTNAIY